MPNQASQLITIKNQDGYELTLHIAATGDFYVTAVNRFGLPVRDQDTGDSKKIRLMILPNTPLEIARFLSTDSNNSAEKNKLALEVIRSAFMKLATDKSRMGIDLDFRNDEPVVVFGLGLMGGGWKSRVAGFATGTAMFAGGVALTICTGGAAAAVIGGGALISAGVSSNVYTVTATDENYSFGGFAKEVVIGGVTGAITGGAGSALNAGASAAGKAIGKKIATEAVKKVAGVAAKVAIDAGCGVLGNVTGVVARAALDKSYELCLMKDLKDEKNAKQETLYIKKQNDSLVYGFINTAKQYQQEVILEAELKCKIEEPLDLNKLKPFILKCTAERGHTPSVWQELTREKLAISALSGGVASGVSQGVNAAGNKLTNAVTKELLNQTDDAAALVANQTLKITSKTTKVFTGAIVGGAAGAGSSAAATMASNGLHNLTEKDQMKKRGLFDGVVKAAAISAASGAVIGAARAANDYDENRAKIEQKVEILREQKQLTSQLSREIDQLLSLSKKTQVPAEEIRELNKIRENADGEKYSNEQLKEFIKQITALKAQREQALARSAKPIDPKPQVKPTPNGGAKNKPGLTQEDIDSLQKHQKKLPQNKNKNRFFKEPEDGNNQSEKNKAKENIEASERMVELAAELPNIDFEQLAKVNPDAIKNVYASTTLLREIKMALQNGDYAKWRQLTQNYHAIHQQLAAGKELTPAFLEGIGYSKKLQADLIPSKQEIEALHKALKDQHDDLARTSPQVKSDKRHITANEIHAENQRLLQSDQQNMNQSLEEARGITKQAIDSQYQAEQTLERLQQNLDHISLLLGNFNWENNSAASSVFRP